MISKGDLVKAVDRVAKGRIVAFHTGYDTNPVCAEDLASEMPMRGTWVHWDGTGPDSMPPVYIPICSTDNTEEDITKYIEDIGRLCARLGVAVVSGTCFVDNVDGTNGILSVDIGVSDDTVVLIYIGEGYEELLGDPIEQMYWNPDANE